MHRRLFSISVNVSETQLRRDLAAAHWLTYHFKMDDLVWNHISARLSEKTYLITPGTSLWDNIGPKDIVESSDNVTANIIHDAIFGARSDVNAIVHLHTSAVRAVSCLKNGLLYVDQNAGQFYGKVAYHDWEGLSDDYSEKQRIVQSLGKEAHTLIMRNHGSCCLGESVGQAWVRAWYLEKVCQTQLQLMQSGGEIIEPAHELLQHAADQTHGDFSAGKYEWHALLQYWERHSRYS